MTYTNEQMSSAFAASLKKASIAIGLLGLLTTAACGVGSADPSDMTDTGGTGDSAAAGAPGATGVVVGTDFELRPDFDVSTCAKAPRIDVNLGNTTDSFVTAAYCQINGTPPPANVKAQWVTQLTTVSYVRRIDVVLSLCKAASVNCSLNYSDPWLTQADLTEPCMRSGMRDVGAVLMFFNDCPGGVNCTMDWANTHAEGMAAASALLSFGAVPSGVYAPKNPGFWRRELLDAAYAGVQFFLLNTYGPDLSASVDPLAELDQALTDTKSVVKIGLFDDTSTWGRASGVFAKAPDLSNAMAAAQTIFDAKWKPFFSRVKKANWYLYNGRPLIYFYNAGTLTPANQSAAVVAQLHSLFQTEFGVSPFVAVDEAYFQDSDMSNQADGRFKWDTFSSGAISDNTIKGVKLDHFMPKWDALGRDHKGQVATATDRIFKDESLLKTRLQESAGSQITVIATWNDMGEGTGITRNYDYFAGGAWLEPDAFMKDIRATQCSN
ncbi:MAG TPA: DUF5010 domain-containing protein [Polyangiaceae bacterium]|jgi:hypothetical protein